MYNQYIIFSVGDRVPGGPGLCYYLPGVRVLHFHRRDQGSYVDRHLPGTRISFRKELGLFLLRPCACLDPSLLS